MMQTPSAGFNAATMKSTYKIVNMALSLNPQKGRHG
jgi:hypothetical protein